MEKINLLQAVLMMAFPLYFTLQIIVAHIVVFTNWLTEDPKLKGKAIWFCLPTLLFVFITKFYIQNWKNNKTPKITS